MSISSRTIEVNGVRLHVEDTGGAGPPVVFSHGLLLSARTWDAQVEALRGGFRCISYDHRGQGQSGAPGDGDLGLDACTADAAGLIEALRLGACHFVGLSMGGFVGMRLAARRPELLASLSLVETSADEESAADLRRYRLMTLTARVLGPWAVAGKAMPVLFGRTFLADPARREEVSSWKRRIASNRRDIWRAAAGAVLDRAGVHEELARIRAPTLVVVGEEDVATPRARADRIVARIPGARLALIPRAGHTAPVEAPTEVTAVLREFLESQRRTTIVPAR